MSLGLEIDAISVEFTDICGILGFVDNKAMVKSLGGLGFGGLGFGGKVGIAIELVY